MAIMAKGDSLGIFGEAAAAKVTSTILGKREVINGGGSSHRREEGGR